MKSDEPERDSGLLEDEEVGELIRSSARRPALPAEDLSAIKAATHTAWREAVQAGRRRRHRLHGMYALAAGIVLGLIGIWWWQTQTGAPPPQTVATVELVTGPIEVGRVDGDGVPESIAAGGGVASGSTLVTGEPAGRAALSMAGGRSLRVDGGTRVRIASASRVELERGALYVDSGPSISGGTELLVGTPLGTVREIGTQYEVRLGDTADSVVVRVREGTVSVSRNGDSETAVRGEQLTLERDGTTSRGRVEPDGREWGWVLAAAPVMEIEGRSLRSYLDWCARETGRGIRFEDAELEAAAASISLHGSIEGLRPDESMDVILEGSGLAYRLENGTVVITRP